MSPGSKTPGGDQKRSVSENLRKPSKQKPESQNPEQAATPNPLAGPVQGLITAGMIPTPLSFSNQRINNHDRIQYSPGSPFRIKKDKGNKGAKIIKSNIITRFAYSTREGFSVHNANKKNQDNFILAPNMC